jgi:hypothetical protein
MVVLMVADVIVMVSSLPGLSMRPQPVENNCPESSALELCDKKDVIFKKRIREVIDNKGSATKNKPKRAQKRSRASS